MPEFSIVIPVYNVEIYLKKCVESVLAQTFDDYEIILVDDGSTDSSGEICDDFARKYDKISVVHQENRGLGGARNTGIEISKGKYLFFLDSDDSIIPGFLEEAASALAENDADMLVFDFAYVDEQGSILGNEPGWKGSDAVFSLKTHPAMLFMPNSAWNKVFRREMFVSSGIRFREKEWFEDLSTIIRLYPLVKKAVYVSKSYYLYLQRAGSIMKNPNIGRNREILTAVNVVLEHYRAVDLYSEYCDELEFLAILHILIFAVSRVVKHTGTSELFAEFRSFISEKFPGYKKNRYIGSLSKKGKAYFYSW